jgi:hypothetical protein
MRFLFFLHKGLSNQLFIPESKAHLCSDKAHPASLDGLLGETAQKAHRPREVHHPHQSAALELWGVELPYKISV